MEKKAMPTATLRMYQTICVRVTDMIDCLPENHDYGIVSSVRRDELMGYRRTKRPNLSGDVLELANALGNGVGCISSMPVQGVC
jgi:hypothetical protein